MMNRWSIVAFLVLGECLITWRVDAMPNLARGHLRLRRSVKRQTLSDPNDCVRQCVTDGNSAVSEIKSRYKLIMVGKAKELGNPSQSDPQLKAAVIANVHEMFQEACKQFESAKKCLDSCPKSDLKEITLIQHYKDQDLVCYPVQANSFEEYHAAENCTKQVRDKDYCDKHCGGNTLKVEDVTSFYFDEQSSPAAVEYETDKKKNTENARKACISIKYHIDCNKPLVTKQCSQDAYKWYVRAKMYEPIATLGSLRYLGVLDAKEPSECADFR